VCLGSAVGGLCGAVALARQLHTLHIWRGTRESQMSICRRVWASVALNAIGGGAVCTLAIQAGAPPLVAAPCTILLALSVDWSSDGGRKLAKRIAVTALRNVSLLAVRLDALEREERSTPSEQFKPSSLLDAPLPDLDLCEESTKPKNVSQGKSKPKKCDE
jgi:hypothetical protein